MGVNVSQLPPAGEGGQILVETPEEKVDKLEYPKNVTGEMNWPIFKPFLLANSQHKLF